MFSVFFFFFFHFLEKKSAFLVIPDIYQKWILWRIPIPNITVTVWKLQRSRFPNFLDWHSFKWNKFPVHNTNDGRRRIRKEGKRRREEKDLVIQGRVSFGPSWFWADLVLGRVGFGPTWFGPSWFWAELTQERWECLGHDVDLIISKDMQVRRADCTETIFDHTSHDQCHLTL